MGVRPACDKGCKDYWDAWWGGAMLEAQGSILSSQEEAKEWKDAATKWRDIAMDYERALREARGTSDEYKQLFRRTIGLHQPDVSDE